MKLSREHIKLTSILLAALVSACTARGEPSQVASTDAASVKRQSAMVHSYASQVNDVDSVNSHWVETDEGTVLIDAQRILPEAERALRHLQASTDRPVVAIFITHAHTDHYGGLPVWFDAYPDARLYMDVTTKRSITTDAKGFIKARRERHGGRFAEPSALKALGRRAIALDDGDSVLIGKDRFEITVLADSESESAMIVGLPERGSVFVGDLVNVGVPAVPFESLENWFAQLDLLESRFSTADIYQGHGPGPVSIGEVAQQRDFLQRLDEVTAEAGQDGCVSKADLDDAAFTLESSYPFYSGVAGNTRQEMLAFNVETVAKQKGFEVGDACEDNAR